MPYNKLTSYGETPNILESEVGLVVKTRTAKNSMAATVGDRKIIKAGTLYTNPDDSNDLGIFLNDYDMTDYTERPVAIVVQGRIRADRVGSDVTAKKTNLDALGIKLV